MFTGIIRHVGKVLRIEDTPSARRLRIDLGALSEGLGEGDSVAVNGVCLTACSVSGTTSLFDVVPETTSRSTLGSLRVGSKVNLERSLRVGDGIEGHMVQGHVDAVAKVLSIRHDGQYVIEFAADGDILAQMVSKGSVTVDGVSLTLAEVGKDKFIAAIIPATLARTTLGDLVSGARVNLELDVIGKYVRAYLKSLAESPGQGLTVDKLKESGFL